MPLAEVPLTNKQHAVPQNIMEVEFKLIGDLTMRQFAYLILFGGIAYLCSVTVVGVFKYPLVVINAILGFGLAFVPIADRGLDEWIVNFIRAVYNPTQRIWRKEPTIPSAFVYENINVVKQEMIALAPTSSRRKLEEYLHYQNNTLEVDPLDIPEAEYINKVRAAYANESPVTTTSPPASVTVLEPSVDDTVTLPQSPEELPEEQSDMSQENQAEGEGVSQVSMETEEVLTEQIKKDTPTITKQARLPQYEPSTASPQFNAAPITPDMHAGRRFTNLLPYGGEIVLPIRGEKVLRTSDERDIEQDISDKADKLKTLLAQIKASSQIAPAYVPPKQTEVPTDQPIVVEPVVDQPIEVSSEAEHIAEKLKQENETLTKEIENLKTEASTNPLEGNIAAEKEARIKELEVQKERTQEDYSKLEQQVLELQDKLKQKQEGFAGGIGNSPVQPVYAKIQPMTTSPNIVTGIVSKPDGTVAEGIVLMLKGEKGDIVRAFKTNSLGQFSLITPLSNGLYTLEVSKDDKATGMSFDIISIQAKGDVIPPLEIIGKNIQ